MVQTTQSIPCPSPAYNAQPTRRNIDQARRYLMFTTACAALFTQLTQLLVVIMGVYGAITKANASMPLSVPLLLYLFYSKASLPA